MIRLLGILLGSSIAVGVLIVFVGVPEFPDAPQPMPDAVPDAVIAAVPDPVPEAQDDTPVDSTKDELAGDAMQSDIAPDPIEDAAINAAAHSEASTDERPVESASGEARWFAFWSPFRSEFAANGFVTQLQRTTGLDYRVIKQEPGVYEVAFAYSNDADAEQKLAQISAATGLDIPEG